MFPFKKQSNQGIDLWEGDPDCQAAHEAILQQLQKLGNFIPPSGKLTTRIQGNLGEFISCQVALGSGLVHSKIYSTNAFDPLQNVSAAGLDITYAYFDSSNPSNDVVYIQEVKTTGVVSLSIADELTADYEKLFGEDPNFNLATRIQAIAMKIELGDKDLVLAERMRALSNTQPSSCAHIRLIPTVVHEKNGAAPQKKLLAVSSAIATLGWASHNIKPCSIAFDGLIDRLERLARGHK